MMKTRHKIMLVVVAVLVLYRIGPVFEGEASDSQLPLVQFDVTSVNTYVKNKEAEQNIRPNNQAHILWADSIGKKTEYVLLYLHGFSASWYEGFPVNKTFAQTFHCNAYFPRLAEHGLVSSKPLLEMTPKNLYDSAKEALLIAKTIGKKVIIMSTSTGGTLSLMLAADYPDLVDGLIMFSPNIEIRQTGAKLLSMPWGYQLGKLVEGGDMRHLTGTPLEDKYWYLDYRVEAAVRLQQLLDERMNKFTFAQVKCPTFVGYYYQDKKHQDDVVSVDAILKMYNLLGTDKKQKMAFADAGRHTIAFEEAGNTNAVMDACIAFSIDYLGMTK